MPDLSINFCGVRSPNPFWLASGPPTNTAYQVMKAFEAGWGGAVWKTIGAPVLNVSNRYGAFDYAGQKMLGINNVELISDRADRHVPMTISGERRTPRSWPMTAASISLAGMRPTGQVPAPCFKTDWLM